MSKRDDFEHYLDGIIMSFIYEMTIHTDVIFSAETFCHQIENYIENDFPEEEVEKSLKRLSTEGSLHVMPDSFTEDYYKITDRFSEEYYKVVEKDGSVVWKCKNIPGWPYKVLEKMKSSYDENFSTSDKEEININKDKWEPLSIERDSIEYKDAISELENVLDVVRSNNGYSETEPEERDEMVWSLETGLEAIQDPNVSKEGIKSLIAKPLKYLSQKFGNAAIGEAAKLAIKALAKILMGFF